MMMMTMMMRRLAHNNRGYYYTVAATMKDIRTTTTTTTSRTHPHHHPHHLQQRGANISSSTCEDSSWRRRRRCQPFSSTVNNNTDDPTSSSSQIRLLRQAWQDSIQNGSLLYDHGQHQAAKRLERLQKALQGYDNQPILLYAIQHQQQQQHNRRKLQHDDENIKEKSSSSSSSSSSSLPAANNVTAPVIVGDECSQQSSSGEETNTMEYRHDTAGQSNTDDDSANSSTVSCSSATETTTTTTTTAAAAASPPPQQQHLPRVPRGLYLHGHVGTGKSMLMDTFFDLVQVPIGRKKRCHFHAFMADIHQRMHALRKTADSSSSSSSDTTLAAVNAAGTTTTSSLSMNHDVATTTTTTLHVLDDDDDDWPILHRVGFQLANDISLLCLDEFQISDVADAMILSQLLHVLFASGVVVVTTSNRPPYDLYPDDVSGEFSFLVQNLMQRYCILYEMDSTIDYRQQQSTTMAAATSSSSTSSSSSVMDDASQSPTKNTNPFWISSHSIQLTPLNDHNDHDGDDDDDTVYRRGCLVRNAVDDILARQLVGHCQDGGGGGGHGGDIDYEPFDLPLGHGRSLTIPQAARVKIVQNNDHDGAVSSSSSSSPPPPRIVHVARMTFHQLCHDDSLLGACDYRALARHFDVVVVEEIPILNVTMMSSSTVAASVTTTTTTQDFNQAKRFVNLIDELYEAKTTALVSSSLQAMNPNQIFIRCYDGDEIPIIDDNDDRMASIGDAEPSDAVARGGAAIDGVVSHGHTVLVNAGIELQFASKRASSRLMEMTSDRWWRRCKRIAKKKESSLPLFKAQTPK